MVDLHAESDGVAFLKQIGKEAIDLRVVIVSDTHIPRRAKLLPAALMKGLKKADVILHAGDWVDLSVYRELSRFAPVYGVAGNCDPPKVRKAFGARRILELEGWRIGIVHGDGQKGTTQNRALAAFEGEKTDLIIFGHSHLPYKARYGRTLLFNPGSPTDRRRNPLYSYGVASLGEKLRVWHVYFKSRL
jgi:putative phosphoesterase